jgi:hypothetical protein
MYVVGALFAGIWLYYLRLWRGMGQTTPAR